MKSIPTAALVCLVPLLLTACAFVPAVKAPAPTLEACHFHTPEWKLSVKVEANFCRDAVGHDLGACLLTAGVIIPVGSFLVSGSLVLIGNTVHWLEYQGSCEDAAIYQKLRSFKTTLGART